MNTRTLSSDEVTRIWQQACSELKTQLSPAVYNTWILANPLTQLEYDDANQALATITSPTAFHSTNLQKNLHTSIKQALEKATSRSSEVRYIVGDAHPPSQQKNSFHSVTQSVRSSTLQAGGATHSRSRQTPPPRPQPSSPPFSAGSTQSPRVEDLFSEENVQSASADREQMLARRVGLRTDYIFETFAVSTSNEMAHAAATAVSNRPGRAYNPLFLYGGVGVGKTHLMHAIGNNILHNNLSVKILYCTGEEFTNEIVQAIQTKKASHFKERYRSADVLLIDDIQFIAGKNAVQEEFFHTFNALTKQQSQIVLTSDRPPHEINLLEDRLRSRFEAGLMIDIQQPSFELRTAIFLVKAKAENLAIPIELAKTIASRVESARKIEGIITSIRSEVELKGRDISADLIEEILKTESPNERHQLQVSPTEVIRTVANHYRLKQTAIKGKRRVKNIVTARHIAMYLLKEDLSLPLAEVGRWFSNRDHTSVLHAIRKVERDIALDERIRRDVAALRTTLTTISG